MKIEDFQPPNQTLAALSLIGGIVTAIALIVGLEVLIWRLNPPPIEDGKITTSVSFVPLGEWS